MSRKKQTVTEGLGLNDGYFKEAKDLAQEKLQALDTISEALEAVAEEVRDKELGETNFRVSDYEKKLILSGFIMGCMRSEAEINHKLEEVKMALAMMAASKASGIPVPEELKMILPPELKQILDAMEEAEKKFGKKGE